MRLNFPTGLEHTEKPLRDLEQRIAATEAKGRTVFKDQKKTAKF